MNKKIVLFSLIFSSCMFGMDTTSERLELCCQIDGPGCLCALFPVTFKEVPQTNEVNTFPIATIIDHAHNLFHVQLPKDAYTDLAQPRKIIYLNSFLKKKQTIKALENLLNKSDTKKSDGINSILMTINSSEVSTLSGMGEYSFLIETAELPQSIKDKCNIISLSKAEIRYFCILVPIIASLLYYLS